MLSNIRGIVKMCPIWVSVNETVNVDGRYNRNMNSEPSKLFFISSVNTKVSYSTKGSKQVQSSKITSFFNNTIGLLWPRGLK